MQTRLDDAGDDAAMDMAPLIDIVFLLLIFFLVATTLKRTDKELPVELPVATAALPTKAAEDVLAIGLDTHGALYLNAEPVTTERLRERLRTAAAQNPSQRIRIDADRDARYGQVIRLLDECSFWGLRNVGFHTRRDSGL